MNLKLPDFGCRQPSSSKDNDRRAQCPWQGYCQSSAYLGLPHHRLWICWHASCCRNAKVAYCSDCFALQLVCSMQVSSCRYFSDAAWHACITASILALPKASNLLTFLQHHRQRPRAQTAHVRELAGGPTAIHLCSFTLLDACLVMSHIETCRHGSLQLKNSPLQIYNHVKSSPWSFD